MVYVWLYMHTFDKFMYLVVRFTICWIKVIPPHKLMYDGYNLLIYLFMLQTDRFISIYFAKKIFISIIVIVYIIRNILSYFPNLSSERWPRQNGLYFNWGISTLFK